MIEIGLAYPKDALYSEISNFACEVYLSEFGAKISPAPDVFAYAVLENRLVGCLGLYRASKDKLLLFETYVQDAYKRLSGNSEPDRYALAELGTRVVRLPQTTVRSGDISLALTATLVSAAYQMGIRYVGFTTTRLVKRITDTLGFTLIALGEPDLSSKDVTFRQNWQNFFRVPQICAGFYISTVSGCHTALAKLKDRSISVRIGDK